MSAAPVLLTLPSGKVAAIEATDGDKTTLRSPEPAPPGSLVRGHVPGCSCEFQLKVRSCRQLEGAFFIDGRVRNASRELRALLLGSPSPGEP
jgi:hypothetical protein